MTDLVRRVERLPSRSVPADPESTDEYLITNGVGGYSSSTISGITTRRFHGLLVSALPSPHGRTMMLNLLREELVLDDGSQVLMDAHRARDEGNREEAAKLTDFWLDRGLPVWRFATRDIVIEKRIMMPNRQNTVHIAYRLIVGTRATLTITPYVHFRPHEGKLDSPQLKPCAVHVTGDHYELWSDDETLPPLRMSWQGLDASFAIEATRLDNLHYSTEESRGYDHVESLAGAGSFRAHLTAENPAYFVASTESWTTIGALAAPQAFASERERRARIVTSADDRAHEGALAELVLAADAFVIQPAGRVVDAAQACAVGDELRTVIAGYHWFTDWGRDTMISLEGLTLATGRYAEARYILRTFARYTKDGLIPNMFPEGNNAGLYHTADASLWFFHALSRYLAKTDDQETLELLFPTLKSIVAAHFEGTRFDIHVDPKDGLLSQGQDGYQLTWMDAKVGDYVVTPRRGKAVELNALFFNALCHYETWARRCGDEAGANATAAHAKRAQTAFNARFWIEDRKYLYDVVDGFEMHEGTPVNDDAFRPNQIFAISLDYPILTKERWKPVVDQVRERLLTPVGLRTLAPGHKDYRPKYFGDLRSRDLAYHQGTVWPWLIGPFLDAYLKVHPDDRAGAAAMLDGLKSVLGQACIGSISEIFDAEAPYTPRGCIAQAWSVAEVLRASLAVAGPPAR
ncbi:MAG: amylo-alpha-1,6-glucosidase [Polyangiaceae bacterium]